MFPAKSEHRLSGTFSPTIPTSYLQLFTVILLTIPVQYLESFTLLTMVSCKITPLVITSTLPPRKTTQLDYALVPFDNEM